ncbi:type IIL restriction-modification enzyme MmeI, partial [Streptomyces sp. NPDC127574]
TREVGLDQATADGWTLYRAVKSQPWFGTAAVVVSLLWLARKLGQSEAPILDNNEVQGITPGLDPASRVSGTPHQLVANEAQSFQGAIVLGKGFVLTPKEAQSLIAENPRNAEVIRPYLNGEDLYQRPGCTASRRVINFDDWPQEKAAEYSEVFAIVERDVKPVRARNKRAARRDRWWQFAERASQLYEAISGMDRTIVIVRHSKSLIPSLLPTNQVFSEAVSVIATSSSAQLALLNSGPHVAWAWHWGSSLKGDLRYNPSDIYETFPRPEETSRLHHAGAALEAAQHAVMSGQGIGLTDVYKFVHSESESAPDIEVIRRAHIEVDEAVAEAYGWTSLNLKHGFHATPQGPRFTIALDVQTEILDRLLELNHTRYGEEVEKGMHTPEAKRRRAATRKAKAKARAAARTPQDSPENFDDGGLFPEPDALF